MVLEPLCCLVPVDDPLGLSLLAGRNVGACQAVAILALLDLFMNGLEQFMVKVILGTCVAFGEPKHLGNFMVEVAHGHRLDYRPEGCSVAGVLARPSSPVGLVFDVKTHERGDQEVGGEGIAPSGVGLEHVPGVIRVVGPEVLENRRWSIVGHARLKGGQELQIGTRDPVEVELAGLKQSG